MYKPVDYLTKIANLELTTLYLLHKSEKVLLPIELEQPHDNPNIYDTFRRTILALNATVVAVKIYLHQETKFYAYLTLQHQDNILDVNTNIEDGIRLGEEFGATLLVEDEILAECGLQVTKEMLENAINAG